MASVAIGTIISYAMTAYSAVSAIQALRDGNILGAIVGGFGAYMGMSSIAGGAGSSIGAAAGDATNLGMTFGEAAGSGILDSAGASSAIFNAGSGAAIGGISDVVGSVGTGLTGSLASSGASAASRAIPKSGFMESVQPSIASAKPSGWTEVLETGKGFVDEIGDLIGSGGEIIAKAGEAVGGTDNLFGIAKIGAGYLMQKKSQEAQIQAIEEAEARKREDENAVRMRRQAAPTYEYSFGRRT